MKRRLRLGDLVRDPGEVRHVGRVVYMSGMLHLRDTIKVRVQWENGWLSDFEHHELELVEARK